MGRTTIYTIAAPSFSNPGQDFHLAVNGIVSGVVSREYLRYVAKSRTLAIEENSAGPIRFESVRMRSERMSEEDAYHAEREAGQCSPFIGPSTCFCGGTDLAGHASSCQERLR